MKETEIKPILVQTQVEAANNSLGQTQPNSPVEVLVPVTIGLIATCAIALFLSKEVFKKGKSTNFSLHPSKIPCQNCYFFSKNSLLKCAVHPTAAMTTESVGCSDFCDRRKKS